jgi:hypothetical protein
MMTLVTRGVQAGSLARKRRSWNILAEDSQARVLLDNIAVTRPKSHKPHSTQ